MPLRHPRTRQVELVQLDDPVRLRPAEVRGAGVIEDEHPGAGRGGRRQMAWVRNDVGHLAQPDGGGEVIVRGSSTATAPSRDNDTIAVTALGLVSINTPT
jgi:hypothetical protein